MRICLIVLARTNSDVAIACPVLILVTLIRQSRLAETKMLNSNVEPYEPLTPFWLFIINTVKNSLPSLEISWACPLGNEQSPIAQSRRMDEKYLILCRIIAYRFNIVIAKQRYEKVSKQ